MTTQVINPLLLSRSLEAALADVRYELYVGKVPETPPDAYVVLYPNGGTARPERLGAGMRRLRWNARTVCVGRSPDQCMNTVAIVRDHVAGIRLEAGHRSSSRLVEVDEGAVIVKDETVDLTDVRFSFTLHWRMSSR